MPSGLMATALSAAVMSGLIALPSFDGAAAQGQSVAQAADAVGVGHAVAAGTRALKGASGLVEAEAARTGQRREGDGAPQGGRQDRREDRSPEAHDRSGRIGRRGGRCGGRGGDGGDGRDDRGRDRCDLPDCGCRRGVSAAFAQLSGQLETAKTSLDEMVGQLIEVSGLDNTGLSPNQVYGIAAGAVGGALVADALGASGLTSLGVMAAAAALGAYAVEDGVVEGATQGLTNGVPEVAP